MEFLFYLTLTPVGTQIFIESYHNYLIYGSSYSLTQFMMVFGG